MIRVSCVHGVGRHPAGGAWEKAWADTLRRAILEGAPDEEVAVEFVYYDSLFEAAELSFLDAMRALAKLTASGIGSLGRTRGVAGSLRWTAGMVVQWVENRSLRSRTRRLIERHVEDFDPHVIAAHSLGSLICYDTFTEDPDVVADRSFVSFGSQIGNPFVVGSFAGGRITPLRAAKHWYHLYNPEDAVFTAPIRLHEPNFTQVETAFDDPGVADHSATSYLGHRAAFEGVWADIVVRRTRPTLFEEDVKDETIAWSRAPARRALLVGINEYPDPAMRLDGCVNDVYSMSAVLQEAGFDAEDIRVVLDDRATAAGILERLEWLLDGVEDEGERVFYYSGHGAQLPTYGLGDRVDRMDETLVPWDFDWSNERSITDDRFFGLYSQLPYGSRFITIFDCCHSGGMTRAGAPRIRGIDPPDDIRHRAMRWDAGHSMWVPRDLDDAGSRSAKGLHRLGCSDVLRPLDRAAMKRRRRSRDHHGPYMPVLVYACDEDEFAFEYRHGATSHGAFTYALCKRFRRLADGNRATTIQDLVEDVAEELSELGFDQTPRVDGPAVRLEEELAFVPGKAT